MERGKRMNDANAVLNYKKVIKFAQYCVVLLILFCIAQYLDLVLLIFQTLTIPMQASRFYAAIL